MDLSDTHLRRCKSEFLLVALDINDSDRADFFT